MQCLRISQLPSDVHVLVEEAVLCDRVTDACFRRVIGRANRFRQIEGFWISPRMSAKGLGQKSRPLRGDRLRLSRRATAA